MSFAWSALIRFESNARGLEVSVTVSPPKVHNSGCEHAHGRQTHAKVIADFESIFPKVINTDDIKNDLKRTLEGAWSGLHTHSREFIVSHPVFNCHGDLLLELEFRSLPTVLPAYQHGKIVVNTAANGNGNGSLHEKESFLRHSKHSCLRSFHGSADGLVKPLYLVIHKAGDAMQSVVTPPPTYTPPFPLLHSNSKASLATSTVSRSSSSSSTSVEVHEKVEQHSLSVTSRSEFEELEEDL